MRVTLLSINSLEENTGGGIYLRCLQKLYLSNGADVNVVCKSFDNRYHKNILTDLLSRVIFFSPSFLACYLFQVIRQCKNSDIIAIHSSRLGFYAWVLKRIYPHKKIYVHTDNVEFNLIKDNLSNKNILRRILYNIDMFLIPLSEKMCVRWGDKITFITREDATNYKKMYSLPYNEKHILPVCLEPKNITALFHRQRNKIIFTGSFDFYPNQEVVSRIIKIAEQTPKLQYIIAGRKLAVFVKNAGIQAPDNVKFESDIEPERLEELYLESRLFLCPVRYGSGMKTKIAEALSYGLYVIANMRSICGYEAAIEAGVVSCVNDETFDMDATREIINCFTHEDKRLIHKPLQVFNDNYNLNNEIKYFSEILYK